MHASPRGGGRAGYGVYSHRPPDRVMDTRRSGATVEHTAIQPPTFSVLSVPRDPQAVDAVRYDTCTLAALCSSEHGERACAEHEYITGRRMHGVEVGRIGCLVNGGYLVLRDTKVKRTRHDKRGAGSDEGSTFMR